MFIVRSFSGTKISIILFAGDLFSFFIAVIAIIFLFKGSQPSASSCVYEKKKKNCRKFCVHVMAFKPPDSLPFFSRCDNNDNEIAKFIEVSSFLCFLCFIPPPLPSQPPNGQPSNLISKESFQAASRSSFVQVLVISSFNHVFNFSFLFSSFERNFFGVVRLLCSLAHASRHTQRLEWRNE